MPISWLYAAVLYLRHKLYDLGVFRQNQHDAAVISVGNLSFGGTGKTPFTLYIARLLGDSERVAILSRGYKRKTKGFLLAQPGVSAEELGDEPLLMFQQLKNTRVAVDANRSRGIQTLLEKTEVQTVILDDALQHRQVKADCNILLTDYRNRYTQNHLVPAGNLRDIKCRAKSAQIIVVTKCPEAIDFDRVAAEINPQPNQHLFFTRLKYQYIRQIGNAKLLDLEYLQHKEVLIFSGIAHPEYLESFVKSKTPNVQSITFPDHHHYTEKDLLRINDLFDNFATPSKLVLTTEKDAVKLSDSALVPHLLKLPIFVLGVEVEFMKDKELFDRELKRYAKTN